MLHLLQNYLLIANALSNHVSYYATCFGSMATLFQTIKVCSGLKPKS